MEHIHADSYRGKANGSRQGREFSPFPRRAWITLNVLPELTGKPWDDLALAYVHSLRPTQLRVVQESAQLDAETWRVTVWLEEDGVTINKISQEVEVGSPDGCTTGFSVMEALKYGINSPQVQWCNLSGGIYMNSEGTFKMTQDGKMIPYPSVETQNS